MEILKLIYVYIFGHLLCYYASTDQEIYEKSFHTGWLILALPSSLFTHGNILAVRLACVVNISAILVILYLFVCGKIDVVPMEEKCLSTIFLFWIFSVDSFELFRRDRYLSKRAITRGDKRIYRSMMCFTLFSSALFLAVAIYGVFRFM